MKGRSRPHKKQLSGGAAATATATASVSGGQVTGIKLTNGGLGYTSTPAVALIGGGGTGARAQAVVSNGVVTGVTLLKGGRNYQSAPNVIISLDGGASLLTYAIQTNPDPLEVPQNSTQVSELTLLVTNLGSNNVNCSSITVTLPGPSQNAQDLTASFSGIGVVLPSDNSGKPLWSVSQNDGAFTLTPPAGGDPVQIGERGAQFIFDNILVNDNPGTCLVSIAEAASSSAVPLGQRNFGPIPLNKWPPKFSISQPTANPTEVASSGSTLIGWTVTGTNVTCQLKFDPDGKGEQTVPVSNIGGYRAENLTNPTGVTFTLQASLTVPAQSSPMIFQEQVTVKVTAPEPSIDFNIEANPVVPGQPLTFTLSWIVTNVNDFQVSADDGPHGNTYTLPVPFSEHGSYVVTPRNLQTTYTMQVIHTDASPEH